MPPSFPAGQAALTLPVPSSSLLCLKLGEVLAALFPDRMGKAGLEGDWRRAALPAPLAGMPVPPLVRWQC